MKETYNPQFFREFDFELVDKSRLGKFIVHGGVGFWEDMMITIKRREIPMPEKTTA